MVSRRDYPEEIVKAARSVLLEVIRILGEYEDDIVVVGGWVPELLFTEALVKHVGSIDVDLALNHREINEAGYKTILQLLLSHVASREIYAFARHVWGVLHALGLYLDLTRLWLARI